MMLMITTVFGSIPIQGVFVADGTASWQEGDSANLGTKIHADFTWTNAVFNPNFEDACATMYICDSEDIQRITYEEFHSRTDSKRLEFTTDKTGEWWAKIVVYTGVGPRDRKTIEAKIDIVDPVTEYTLTISVVGGGMTDPSVGTHTYEEGSVVDVEAFANSGWSFDEWSGDKSGSTNPTTITMSRDKSVTAHFNDNTDPIEADPGGPYVGVKDEVIQFSGLATGGTGLYDWHWDFGDDATSNKKNPSHTYSKAKLYNVTLTVTDGNGNTASESVNAAIGKTYTNKYAIVLRGPSDPNIANGNDEKYLDWAYDNMQMCLGVNGFQIYNLYQPDLADFNAACQSASNKADKDDLFILVMMGHGIKDNGVHKFYINDRQYESERLIEETRIPGYINNIKCQQVVVMFSCHSGGFLDDLSRSDTHVRRIVITSSKKDEVTYGGSGFLLSLMNGFLGVEESDLDENGIVTIEEIFRYASNSIGPSLKNLMHPLLDDNGDTEGHTIYDAGYTQIPNDPGKDGFFSSITTLDCGPSSSSKLKAKNKPTILPILRFLQGLMDRFPILERLLTMPLIFNRILN